MKRFLAGRGRAMRRAAVAPLTIISAVFIFGMAALAIDASMLWSTRAELQRTADAAALAGAHSLIDDQRIAEGGASDTVFAQARGSVTNLVADNPALQRTLTIDSNSANSPSGDVVLGQLSNPDNQNESLSFAAPAQFNAVAVKARMDAERNGSITLFFGRLFGVSNSSGRASATAAFRDDVIGYRVNERTGNAELMPIALHVDYWNMLLAGTYTSGDLYSYDPDTGTVSDGPDGINEINLYPGAGSGQLPPGNFGTVDIGSSNNSTADISRQIRYGVNESDLAYFGGELRLGPDGTLMLNGDTGLSAAIKDDLQAIRGLPRAIPLFNQVSGNGNNSMFRVVGFGGIRIMFVQLTGAMKNKKVIVQPCYVVDDSVITGGSNQSRFVVKPPYLVR